MLDLIQWRARKTPDARALFFNGRWYNFRELEGRANRLANRLLALGVRPGERVAVLANNHVVHFDLLLAAPKIGIVFVPLNPLLEAEQLEAVVAAVKPAMLFVDSRHDATAAALGVAWTRLAEYRDWLSVGSVELPPVPALDVNDPHTLLATPQGIAVLPYRQVLLNARHAADAWGLSAQDSTVHCLPCSSAELFLLSLPLLYRGGRVVLMSTFDADEYLGHLALHRVTVAALAPQMLRQITEYSDFENADLSSLNWFASVGAPVARSVAAVLQARGLALCTLHAFTVAGPNLFTLSAQQSGVEPGLLGTPLPDVTASLLRDDGSACGVDEPGALHIAGALAFAGYLDDPAATAAVFTEQGCHTGTMARRDAAGRYHWLGLQSHCFVRDGVVVYPCEIEAALLQLDGVLDCAVISLEDATHGSTVVAAVVLQDGITLDVPALHQAISTQLPPALLPQQVFRLGSLPRDVWGSVRRLALAQQFVQSRLRH